jgi:xylulokinase
MDRTVLAVDIGTSSLKAALVTARGDIVASARCRFPRTRRTPADWVAAFDEAVAILKAGDAAAAGGLAAVAVSGNGPTLVSVEPDGTPGELLLWNAPVPQAIPEALDGAGANASRSRSLFIPRILAFRDLFPSHYENARWILSGPEYLIWHLTGNAVTILPEARFVDAYWTGADLASARLDATKLAPFALTGEIVGETGAAGPSRGSLSARGIRGGGSNSGEGFRRGADALRAGIPIVAGGPDFTVALIGTGTIVAGKACDRAGTSEGLNVCTENPVSYPGVRPLPAAVSGLWNAAYLLPETGADFNAYRRESGQTTRSYPDLMAEIEASPIIPARGEPTHPGREAVEKIGFAVRKGIETLGAATGLNPEYCLSGGQARNETWSRMKADITGATFTLTATPDGELMGDAIAGFAATGEYASVAEAAGTMVRVVRTYEPDPARHALYTEKYLAHESI